PEVQAALLQPPAKRTPQQAQRAADHYAKLDPQLVRLNKAAADHRKAAPTPTLAQTLALGPGRKTHVLVRGDFLRPGAEVRPDTPAALPPLDAAGKPTRLDLA